MQLTPHLALFCLAGLAATQDISSLPSCASAGALQAITASGCRQTDIVCICKSSTFITGLQSYAKANCSPQDYSTAVTVGQTLCAQAGVTLTTTTSSTPVATSGTTSTGAGTMTDSVTTTSISTPTPSTTPTDTAMTPSRIDNGTVVTTTKCSCVTEVYTIPAVPTTTVPPTIATFTGAAGASGGKRDGVGLVAGILGVMGLMIV